MTPEEKHAWLRIYLHLMGQYRPLFPTTASVHLPSIGATYDGLDGLVRRREDLKNVSSEYNAVIDAAIDAHTMRLEAAMLEGQAKIWLSRRVEAALFLAAAIGCSVDEKSSLVFQPPALEDKAVIHYLLTDWWYKHGLKVWAEIHPHPG